jgi:hypothetical protein
MEPMDWLTRLMQTRRIMDGLIRLHISSVYQIGGPFHSQIHFLTVMSFCGFLIGQLYD